MTSFDLSVYAVLDLAGAGERAAELAARVVRGGATMVQLRDKRPGTAAIASLAARIRPRLEAAGVPLIVNDRVELALACAAQGVHLGQEDTAPAVARELAAKAGRADFLIGLSVSTPAQALEGVEQQVDYLSVSPLFATATKPDTQRPAGLSGVRAIRRACPAVPLVAIGGISARRAAEVIRAGADGVAFVSAAGRARDPEAATREIAAAVLRGKRERQRECGAEGGTTGRLEHRGI